MIEQIEQFQQVMSSHDWTPFIFEWEGRKFLPIDNDIFCEWWCDHHNQDCPNDYYEITPNGLTEVGQTLSALIQAAHSLSVIKSIAIEEGYAPSPTDTTDAVRQWVIQKLKSS